MSGPKLMELRRLRREARRQHNKDRCEEFNAEYPRLVAEFEALRRRLEELGEIPRAALVDANQAAREAANAIQNNKDDEAAKRCAMLASLAREEIDTARRRIASRLIELRERHRIAGASLDRWRLERDSLLAKFEAFASRPDVDEAAKALSRKEAGKLREATSFSSVAWAAAGIEDAAALSSVEQRLAEVKMELQKGGECFEALSHGSGHPQASEDNRSARPVSFAEFWDHRERPAPAAKAALADGTSTPQWAASLHNLLKKAAALPTSSLYRELCAEADALESVGDPAVRQTRAESLMIRGMARVARHRELLRFREEITALLDQAAPFQELQEDPLVPELQGLLTAPMASDLSEVKRRHAEMIERAQARREREAKRLALLESLRELGYETTEGMDTAFTESGRLVVHKRDDTEYGIELVADSSLDKVQTAMVRYSSSQEMSEQQRLRDREQEASWCSEHGKLRRLMERRGWESDMKMQRPPGEHPVRVVVDPSRAPRTGARTAAPPKARAR